jgi:thiol-disulfide isomerase/thioredoxin
VPTGAALRYGAQMPRTRVAPAQARIAFAVALAISACGDPTPPRPSVDASVVDLGVDGGSDLGPAPPPDLGPCPDRTPAGPYGNGPGDALEPFRFDDCDGIAHDLYGAEHCATSATVVNFAAGWCEPCFQETAELQTEIVERYGDAVRVIQVLFEDASFGDVEPAECRAWVERFETTGVETLVTTTGEVSPYLVRSSVPTTFVTDGRGRIRLALDGTEPGLPNVRAAIEAILAE